MSAPSGPVTLINVFTVPVEESELFLSRWRDNAAVISTCPGSRYAEMHQALDQDTELRFVNVAVWDDAASLAAARALPKFQDTVRAMVTDPGLHISARPAVYQVVEYVPGPSENAGRS